MEKNQSSNSIIYNEKECSEIPLDSGSGDGPTVLDSPEKSLNSVQESPLNVGNSMNKDDNPLPFDEKVICTTGPQESLYNTYVSKTILSPGTKGLRPHLHSTCSFVVETLEVLDPDFSQIVENIATLRRSVELNLEIGSSNSEIEKALELALLDMNEAEKSELILCATKRKGKLRDQFIVPTPCIKCVIKLAKINNCNKPQKSSHFSHSNELLSILNASKEEKYLMALKEKSHGVDLFRNQQHVDAFHRFALGVKILLTIEADDLSPSHQSLLSTLCSNMAECQLKEDNPSNAISLCMRALQCDPCNVKALYRQASATWALGDADQADLLLKRLFELDPNNLSAKRLNCEVQDKIRKYKDEYSKMMKRIFKS